MDSHLLLVSCVDWQYSCVIKQHPLLKDVIY